MADVRAALRALMLSDPAINSAVGGNRIYPTILPQGVTAPSIVLQRISGFTDVANDGPTGLDRPRFQIAAWAQGVDSAAQLIELVKAKINGFTGPVTYGTSTLIFRGIFFDIERDSYDDISKLFSSEQDYLIWYADR
jgi:hypothetical protein